MTIIIVAIQILAKTFLFRVFALATFFNQLIASIIFAYLYNKRKTK
jgi:hypothetical protein